MVRCIDYFGYSNPFLKFKTFFSLRARKKMYKMFETNLNPKYMDRIIDVGATPDTILEDSNFFEKLYPYKQNITIASIEDCNNLVQKFHLNKFVKTFPHEKLPFNDNEFDILFSSAVLEHVGTREDQKFFIDECFRISKNCMITTPYRYFPLEMHTFIPFLHWLPWNIFQKIVYKIKGPFWGDINNLNLLSEKDLKGIIPSKNLKDCKINYIYTVGFKSNMVLIKKQH